MKKSLYLLLLIFPAFLFAQTPGQKAVQQNLEKYSTRAPQERMYLQFDKPAYNPGETIWFKAYLMSGIEPSIISRNIYFDFADEKGNILSHIFEPVVESSSFGNFQIPQNYASDKIFVRAYTKWMLNFDSSFLFNKTLPVIQKNPVNRVTAASKPNLRFFPEGGDLYAGIDNRIAFKSIYADGKPFAVSGDVLDEKNVTVAKFRSTHDGMGSFNLHPTAGVKYKAVWKDDKGVLQTTMLPESRTEGLSLEIKNDQGKKGFIIRKVGTDQRFSQAHIIATLYGQLAYMASVNLSANNIVSGSIPTAEIPSGILQITLFDSGWIPVAERISFVDNNDYRFDPEVGFSVLGTGKRGKNTLVINVPTDISANLSLSVTDKGIGSDSSDNIISHLLVTGELRGIINNPAYYFRSNDDSVRSQLDLVMLTNGWRKINWKQVVTGKLPEFKYQPDTNYFSLSGKIYGASPEELRASPLLFLILQPTNDSTRDLAQVAINPDATFSDPDKIIFDTVKVYYSVGGTSGLLNSSELKFNSPITSPRNLLQDQSAGLYFRDTAAENRSRFLASEQERLNELMEGATLENVTVRAKTKSKMELMDEKYATGLFSGGNATSFDILNDPTAQSQFNVLTYLQGRVAGLQISGGNSGLSMGSQPSISWRGGKPALYLNEMQVDQDQLSNISMADVAYIKVFQPPFIGPYGGGSGAIAVYLRKGGEGTARKGKGLPFKVITGYTPQKEFYSPDYATFDVRHEKDDLRSTLYWNPMILTTPENHILKFNFYNNDVTEGFRVIVEGMSKDGRMTSVEKVIE